MNQYTRIGRLVALIFGSTVCSVSAFAVVYTPSDLQSNSYLWARRNNGDPPCFGTECTFSRYASLSWAFDIEGEYQSGGGRAIGEVNIYNSHVSVHSSAWLRADGERGFVSINQHASVTADITNPPYYSDAGASAHDVLIVPFTVSEIEGPVQLNLISRTRNTDPIHGVYFNFSLIRNGNAWPSSFLEPGNYTMRIEFAGAGGQVYQGSLIESASLSAVWSFNSTYHGEDVANPFSLPDYTPISHQINSNNEVLLDVPIFGSHGSSEDVFVAFQPRIPSGLSAGALATGYTIASTDLPITSFVMPELLAGGAAMTVQFNDVTQPIIPGQRIDFGPEGIESFTLAGFDPTGVSSSDAFVMGLRFSEGQMASLTAEPILFIPPGDFDQNGFVNGRDFLAWQRGESPDPLSAGDLAVWQANYHAEPLGALTAVPEPASALLLLGVCGAMAYDRRRC